MPDTRRPDPMTAFRFHVEIDQLIKAHFSDVSGLTAEIQLHEQKEGGRNDFIHQLPANGKFNNLVLKRGLANSDDLWVWFFNTTQGKVVRKSGRVLLYDAAGKLKCYWNFTNAFPVKWEGPEFNAAANQLAVEKLELVHQGLEFHLGS